jgi:hypothetical protein
LLLLLTIMIGLSSLMTFDSQSLNTTKLAGKAAGQVGMSSVTPAEIVVEKHNDQMVFTFRKIRMPLTGLVDSLQQNQVSAIILRGGNDTKLQWPEIVNLVSALSRAGVKEVSYDVQALKSQGG